MQHLMRDLLGVLGGDFFCKHCYKNCDMEYSCSWRLRCHHCTNINCCGMLNYVTGCHVQCTTRDGNERTCQLFHFLYLCIGAALRTLPVDIGRNRTAHFQMIHNNNTHSHHMQLLHARRDGGMTTEIYSRAQKKRSAEWNHKRTRAIEGLESDERAHARSTHHKCHHLGDQWFTNQFCLIWTKYIVRQVNNQTTWIQVHYNVQRKVDDVCAN